MSWFGSNNNSVTEVNDERTLDNIILNKIKAQNEEALIEEFIEKRVYEALTVTEEDYREFKKWKLLSPKEQLSKSLTSVRMPTVEPFLWGAYLSADFLGKKTEIQTENIRKRLLNFITDISPNNKPNMRILGTAMRDLYLLMLSCEKPEVTTLFKGTFLEVLGLTEKYQKMDTENLETSNVNQQATSSIRKESLNNTNKKPFYKNKNKNKKAHPNNK